MARRDLSHKESFNVEAEAFGDIRDADLAGEEARFLPVDSPPRRVSSKASQRYVVLMSVQFLFMIEFSQFIMESPLQAIMEDFVCHASYPDHAMGSVQVQDPRCKESDVQGTLAMTRSWMLWVGMLVPLLVQIPYGIIADKYGRRPVLFLGLLGIVLATIWDMIVLLRPDVFSIWHLLLGAIPTLIGGGAPVITAMVWTILSDAVPNEKRASLFYQLHAMMLILSAAFRPFSAWLLSINPWLPMWLGLGALILSMFSTLLIPETLQLESSANDKHHQLGSATSRSTAGVLRIALKTARKNISHIWRFVLGSENIMLLVVAYGLGYPIMIAFEMNMLQYVTKRFSWDWSTATYFTTISKVTSVVVLLVFLPLVSMVITKRLRLEPLTRDLYLSRGSVLFVVAGNVLTSLSAAPWLLVVSLIILSVGNGFQPQVRAILAGVVEQDTLATLNTAIASFETLMGLVTVPALGWLLSKGIALGGFWMGLPFVMTSVCAALSAAAMFRFKIPQGITQGEAGYHLVNRPRRDPEDTPEP